MCTRVELKIICKTILARLLNCFWRLSRKDEQWRRRKRRRRWRRKRRRRKRRRRGGGGGILHGDYRCASDAVRCDALVLTASASQRASTRTPLPMQSRVILAEGCFLNDELRLNNNKTPAEVWSSDWEPLHLGSGLINHSCISSTSGTPPPPPPDCRGPPRLDMDVSCSYRETECLAVCWASLRRRWFPFWMHNNPAPAGWRWCLQQGGVVPSCLSGQSGGAARGFTRCQDVTLQQVGVNPPHPPPTHPPENHSDVAPAYLMMNI